LQYDAGESRRRLHVWDEPRAGFLFEEERGIEVGKCSSEISPELAQRLLNEGIPYNPATWKKIYPRSLYNVFQGTPYRAHQVGRGCYHGFPEKPGMIPPVLVDELRARARDEGCESQFESWMAREDP